MPIPVPLLFAAAAGLALVAAGKNAKAQRPGASGEPSPVLTPEVLVRLKTCKFLKDSIALPGTVTYIYSSQSAGRRAIDSLLDGLDDGRDAYTTIAIIGAGDFPIAYRPAGSAPPGDDWFVLATKVDHPVLKAAATGDAPPIARTPVMPVEPTAPAKRTETGIPDVDRRLRDPATTPAQLWAIADALEAAGKPAEAAVVRARADELYASLRAKHAAAGGTPFLVEEGHFPANVAKHYGGTLTQFKAANPGKDLVTLNKDWLVGREFFLPLSWDAERKAPPTPVKGRATKTATKPDEKPNEKPSEKQELQHDPYKAPPYPPGPH